MTQERAENKQWKSEKKSFERSCSNLSQQIITLTWCFDSKTNVWYKIEQTEDIVSVINKRTFSRTRRASYQDTSRTSCSNERRIEAHREHSIIEERTFLTSITKRLLVTKRFFVTKKSFVTNKFLKENQRSIFYNIFDRRSMSFLRAHDDMKKKTSFVCQISKMMIWQTTHW